MAEHQPEQQRKESVPEREERILKFWQENKTFEKSLAKESPKGEYVFYDGPPFATGTPHYGHILGSVAKDIIGRYQTMRGYHVPRRWGWDCHGLPIENIVEKVLKISGRKEIEAYGIEKFSESARSQVLTYVEEWKKTIDRIGRWVDFDNSYKTMDNSFIESVWWALGELNKKGLLYEGVRTLAYCPRCETPIANSEIAMDNSYKDIADVSVYVRFNLVSTDPEWANTALLAWTTTAWTLPGDVAVAIKPDIDYVCIPDPTLEGHWLVLGKPHFERLLAKGVFPADYAQLPEGKMDVFKGEEMVGMSFAPIFDYYSTQKDLPNKENCWKVYAADFVTETDGTGVVHIASAFGEDDKKLGDREHLPFVQHVTPNGRFKPEVTEFAGEPVKPKEDHQSGDVLVIKHLAQKGLLFAKEKIVHSYPHCYRCETPLYYYALPSWFVNIQKVKEQVLTRAEEMSWIPAHLKEGRFKGSMEVAPDWTISRNRFWASPLPIWKSTSGKMLFMSSFEELRSKTKKSGNTYYVMRHGRTNANEHHILNQDPQADVHLTEEGKQHVREMVAGLKEKKITRIVHSGFHRTKETAEIVAEELGLDASRISTEELFHETIFGAMNGRTVEQYRTFFATTRDRFMTAPEGGETHVEMRARMMAGLDTLEKTYSKENILIVGHGGPLWALERGCHGETIEQMSAGDYHADYLDNAAWREISYVPYPHNARYELDVHRPYIDAITLVDGEEEYKRIPEVIDCWFESGSMPFAQDHYPFERPHWKQENFPADFVAEYIAQKRTWFYYTHVLSTILFDQAPFKNVVTTGNVLAENGQKMSKSKNNFPDPWLLFNKYGVDALRFYMLSGPLMKGEDLNFLEKGVDEVYKKLIGRFDNVIAFYELYRDPSVESWTPGVQMHQDTGCPISTHVLDRWILARLDELIAQTTSGMEAYDMPEAMRPFDLFVDDLSTWYLRRSRDRLKNGDAQAKQTLHHVLITCATLMAPFMPFLAEDVWLRFRGASLPTSVHLLAWPEGGLIDRALGEDMKLVREIASLGLEARAKANIKVRQPLATLKVKGESGKVKGELLDLIKDEINVKEVLFVADLATPVELDFTVTPELKQEGELRELMRTVQDLRKEKGLQAHELISLSLPNDKKELVQRYEAELKKGVKAERILFDHQAEISLQVV
ncbi:MAG: hypothetical protein A2542_03060 [Parcubacteria group bacterium RIFOXYD2_FULL_52_8]|nr:MAG: hypothetical protein A2542_03060 [Parcubacteria group bacterium RIFOXYD2_FULL_52_8]